MSRSKGFTLVEIAIVMAIGALLIGTIFMGSRVIIGGARTTDTITLIKDLSAAIDVFRITYHYLPGDLPMAGDNIPGVSAACNIATSTANIGNGQVDTNDEITCVAEHLVRAGLIKGSTAGIFSKTGRSTTADVLLTARRTTGLLPPAFPSKVINEIQLRNQPCETAQAIDEKLDDGNFATGNVRASVASCTEGSTVPIIDIAR